MFPKNIKFLATANAKQFIRSISFDLPNEIKTVQKTCKDFSEKELRPVAAEIDQQER